VNLSKIYDELIAQDLSKELTEIKQCHSNNQSAQCWKLINDIKRKSHPSHVQGATAEEGVAAFHYTGT
jgi:hypothetical protein